MDQTTEHAHSAADLMQAARDLMPLVEAEADEAERLRHQTDKIVAAFKAADLYKMLTPKVAGGSELSPVEAMEIVEEISYADGSAGWCLMVGCIEVGNGAAYLPQAGVDTLFEKTTDILIAGQGSPSGFARKVDGGYRIDGNWSYGSGIYHADFIHTGCILMEGDQPVITELGIPHVVLCHALRSDIELKDNWDVIGLRGTGSYDYSIRDTFIPEHMTYPFTVTKAERGNNMYAIGIVGWTAWGHTSFAMGVGRRALDELAELARNKKSAFGLMGDSTSFQEKYALAQAKMLAVRDYCYHAWTDLSESLLRDEPPSLEQIALIRLGMRYLHEVVSEVCTFAHRASGGVSLRPSVLQRCYRDIHAGTQHILLSDQILQECGKVLLGLAPENAQWTLLGVNQPVDSGEAG